MANILTNNINPRSGNTITIGGANDRVSIAGTLTYEDVINIDSVGIITARGGLNVGPLTGIAFTVTSAGAITAAVDATINSLTIGLGGGAVATNTAVGTGVLNANPGSTDGDTSNAAARSMFWAMEVLYT